MTAVKWRWRRPFKLDKHDPKLMEGTRCLKRSLFFGVCLVFLAVQHKAQYPAASECIIPSLTALFSTGPSTARMNFQLYLWPKHTASPLHWKPATSTWNGNMVGIKSFCLDLFLNLTPFASLLGVFPLSHSSSVCVILWRTDFPERKWKGLLAEERERRREIRGPVLRLTTDQFPCTINPPTHPAASQPSQDRINPHAGHITARLHQCLLAC